MTPLPSSIHALPQGFQRLSGGRAGTEMFDTVLIANRGAIACRIIRTLQRMGIRAVAVYSEADRDSVHVRMADAAVCIGPAPAAQSYLRADAMLEAARQTGAQAIHPGYGFLSENPDFAEACEAAGIAFIGPTPAQMRAFGLKHTARELAQQNGVPLLPGSGLLADAGQALAEARRIGFPVMLKSTAGGGGIGMQLIGSEDQLPEAYARVERLARANFKEAGIYLEQYVQSARHIEVQVFGDGAGHVVHLGERDCSVQRRNQKVIEETPAPHLPDTVRQALCDTALRLMRSVNYRNAGTVEYVLDADTGAFYFLEVNTRLQVEHRVTEAITGLDLVGLQLEMAMGYSLPRQLEGIETQGHAIEARIYGESTGEGFIPSSGRITSIELKNFDLVDQSYQSDDEVSIFYDSMIAKVVTHGRDRETAISKLAHGLFTSHVAGVDTNLQLLRTISRDQIFQGRFTSTNYIGQLLERADENSLSEQPPKAVVAAAAIYFIDRAVRSGGTLSNLPTSFRNLPSKAFSLDLQINEREVEIKYRCDRQNRVSFEADGIDIGPTSYTVRPDSIVIETDGLRQRFPYKSRGEVVIIEVATASIPFTKVSSYKRKEQVALGSLTTKMAGTITKVMVEVGDEVKTGETIAVIEAMKIEQPIISPSDGKVEELYVSLNQRIDRGVTVAKISP